MSSSEPAEDGGRSGSDFGADRPEWTVELHTPNAEVTKTIGANVGRQLRRGDLIVLTGELGAGKTTFTQGLGAGLGVREGIISPTFVLVRIHPNEASGPNPGGPDLVHVDAYRLVSAGEIDDVDLENTMDSAVTVVEWGRDRVEHLAESRLEIELLRPIGGATQAEGKTDNAHVVTETGSPVGTGAGVVLDFAAQDDDEPRTLTIAGFGPRWVGIQPTLIQQPEVE